MGVETVYGISHNDQPEQERRQEVLTPFLFHVLRYCYPSTSAKPSINKSPAVAPESWCPRDFSW